MSTVYMSNKFRLLEMFDLGLIVSYNVVEKATAFCAELLFIQLLFIIRGFRKIIRNLNVILAVILAVFLHCRCAMNM